MKKIISYDSPKEHYKKRTRILIWCFDGRMGELRDQFQEFLKKEHGDVDKIDLIQVAGGVKDLVEPGPDREYILKQIRKSVSLHEPEGIELAVHIDCGDYGGSGLHLSKDAEITHHQSQLAKAAEVVRKAFPHLKLRCNVADFDGLYQLEDKEI